MSLRVLGRGALAMALVLAVTPLRAVAQSPTAASISEAQMAALQEQLARATAEFEGPQQSRSIAILDEVIGRLDGFRQENALPVRARDLLIQAHEMRSRAYFNIGLADKAKEGFRAMVHLQPQYAMSRERVSPKVVDVFNAVKKDLVGFLAVSSKPAGAKVAANGEFLGLTDFFPIEVLAGDYNVEVARAGYKTETRTITVAARATETLQVELNRVSASYVFTTEPPGVEIWVDGQLRATTGGTADPESAEALRAGGLDPSLSSARTEIAEIALGGHAVEFRRKCHETKKATLEVAEARDYVADPVRLEKSLASLHLTSDPPGAQILLDGEMLGRTPRALEEVCAGPHRLEVKHTSGKFVQDILLARGESLAVDCPIRPSLAFLGVVADGAAGQRVATEVEEKLIPNLAKIATLNFVPAAHDLVDQALEAEGLSRRALLAGPGSDSDVIRRVTGKLSSQLEAQGFLIALLPDERLPRAAVLHLLAAGNSVSDPWSVAFNEPTSYKWFTAAVDQKVPIFRPWSGLITVDTLSHEGVPVLRVVPGSPGAEAGIEVGEVLDAVDGKPVKATADLLGAIGARKARETLSLNLKKPGGNSRTVTLTLGETPQEVPLNDPTLLYNKVMMDLRQQVEGYPGTEAAAFARLNLAICAMHFGDYAAAHEHLLKAQAELPKRPGLSQGTALYYLGLSLDRLGYKKEAVEAYKTAAAFTGATLFNNDGPALAPLAARRAGAGER